MSNAFLTEIPPRSESILKLVAHGWNSSNALTTCAISSLEAPSAMLCARLLFPDLKILINEIPDPDPRLPERNVATVAWEYTDTNAVAALPYPNQGFADAIAASIDAPFSLDEWGETAARLATEFDGLAPCEMLGVMVFPPRFPQDQWPWDWMFRAQLLCALVFARTQSADWLACSHAVHILDTVAGPIDWTTTAALFALMDVARHDTSTTGEITLLFLKLLKKPMSPIWFMCGYQPIWQMFQHFPGLPPDLSAKIQRTVEELESEDDEQAR